MTEQDKVKYLHDLLQGMDIETCIAAMHLTRVNAQPKFSCGCQLLGGIWMPENVYDVMWGHRCQQHKSIQAPRI